jgi:hypothetical protein
MDTNNEIQSTPHSLDKFRALTCLHVFLVPYARRIISSIKPLLARLSWQLNVNKQVYRLPSWIAQYQL